MKLNKTNTWHIDELLKCPKCLGGLKQGLCASCLFKVEKDENNIYRLTDDNGFYYREKSMPRPLLRKIIQSEDIFAAAYRVFNNEAKWRYDFYATDPNRGIGSLLCNLAPDSVVLDYGCGWGNIAKFMSHYVKQVVGMDMTYESLVFAQRTMPNGNVAFLHGGDGKFLPFGEDSFDLVFLNGLLEWLPEYDLEGNPRDVQLNFLREVRRILRPNGQLLIGIENRYAAIYFLGTPDEHTHLLFATLLPRPLSNLISKIKNKKPYRIYTYSRRGYRKLLGEAGFFDAAVDIPYPDYRQISYLFLSRNLKRRKRISLSGSNPPKRLLKNFLVNSRLIKYFAHSFLVHSNFKSGSLLERILKLKNEDLSHVKRIRNQGYKCTVLVETNNFIYKIPAALTSSRNLKREVDTVNYLSKKEGLRRFLPEMESFPINGMNVQISRREPACGELSNDEMDGFFRIKERMAVKKKAGQIYSFMNIEEYLRYNGQERLFEDFIRFLGDEPLDCAFAHGDFHSRNLIPAKDGVKIIDWEFFSLASPLEIDYINSVLYEETFLSGRKYFQVLSELLKGELKISENNRFKKYESVIKSASPRILLLYALQHQDFIMGRYERVAFIPYAADVKIKAVIELLKGFIGNRSYD